MFPALSPWLGLPQVRNPLLQVASSNGTHVSGSLRIIIPKADVDSSADEMEEMSAPASPSRLPNLRGLTASSMTHTVTSSVIYVHQPGG